MLPLLKTAGAGGRVPFGWLPALQSAELMTAFWQQYAGEDSQSSRSGKVKQEVPNGSLLNRQCLLSSRLKVQKIPLSKAIKISKPMHFFFFFLFKNITADIETPYSSTTSLIYLLHPIFFMWAKCQQRNQKHAWESLFDFQSQLRLQVRPLEGCRLRVNHRHLTSAVNSSLKSTRPRTEICFCHIVGCSQQRKVTEPLKTLRHCSWNTLLNLYFFSMICNFVIF